MGAKIRTNDRFLMSFNDEPGALEAQRRHAELLVDMGVAHEWGVYVAPQHLPSFGRHVYALYLGRHGQED